MEFKLVNQKLTLSLNDKLVRLNTCMFRCPAQPERDSTARGSTARQHSERQHSTVREAAQREAASQRVSAMLNPAAPSEGIAAERDLAADEAAGLARLTPQKGNPSTACTPYV